MGIDDVTCLYCFKFPNYLVILRNTKKKQELNSIGMSFLFDKYFGAIQ